MSHITVFTAQKIITMEPSLPEATAVAVRDGKIIEVGSLETLKPWLDTHPHTIDARFENHILTPGFIDPHLHPSMAAVLLQMRFATATEWRLPWETISPVTTPEAFASRAKQVVEERDDTSDPVFVWGYHQLWHGKMNRTVLDDISLDHPLVVWHRSFHEVIVNSAALKWMGLDPDGKSNNWQVNLDEGHFYEGGLRVALDKLMPYLMAPARYEEGLNRLRQVVHFGGHTTIGDMAAGLFNLGLEWDATTRLFETDATPFRVFFIPEGNALVSSEGGIDGAIKKIHALQEQNTHRLKFIDHVKLFTDGAFFSQLMQLGGPGYIDGHDGEWLAVPEKFEESARGFWNAGLKIHVHCCGDLGIELALDVLEKLQWERPRFRHGFTFEHFGVSTPEQCRRVADLGAFVSANIYYLYELSDMYSRQGLGYERASQIVRLKTLLRNNVSSTIHSDYTMAPALPLNSAWVAVNRINSVGNLMNKNEAISVHEALEAITINAARVLGVEDEVGTIRSGKKADFTVLEQDPYQVDPMSLKDIPIWGTVFEGQPASINQQ